MDEKKTSPVDFKTIARNLIDRQLRIKPGEVVQINGGLHNLEFLEEIAVRVRQLGAFPNLDLGWATLARRLTEEVPDEALAATPHHRVKIEEMIDCFINLPSMPDPAAYEHIDPRKIMIRSRAFDPVREANVRRGARRIGIGFPTRALAKTFGLSFRKYEKLFWGAVEADLDRIQGLCNRVRERLTGVDRCRLVSPEGHELIFSVQGRRINMDDGVISDEDLKSGDITANLPFGEVYLAPIEESVEGEAAFPAVFYRGKKIEKLLLRFHGGRLIHSQAATNHGLFREAFELGSGDRDRIGELGIGTNHSLRSPMGDNLLDEKIHGSIHLALGENRNYGGLNNSTIHWDMVMLKPTLTLDGRPLLVKGHFVP